MFLSLALTMLNTFIILFISLFVLGMSVILYQLLNELKNVRSSDPEKDQLKEENLTNIASKAAEEAAKKALEETLKLQQKDWEIYKQDISTTIEPISKTVKELDDRIEYLQKERKQEIGQLDTRLADLLKETNTLSAALSSSTSVQGKWGEIQLRNIVEKSGMINHVDFEEQKGTETGDSIPDMIIKLPNGGIIPVDSKCPMKDFRASLEEQDAEKRKALQVEHAKKCRQHMRTLSSKKYQDQYNDPIDFVVMLIPFEPGFQSALLHDGNLFNDGAETKVFVVSPISLMPLLNLVSETWRQMSLTKNANSIINTAKDLSDRLKKYEELYNTVGDRITSLGKAYNTSVSSYNARLKPSVRDIQKLQDIPEDLTDLDQVNLDVKPVIERLESSNSNEEE